MARLMVLSLLVSISTSTFCLELKARQKPQTVKFRIAAVTEHALEAVSAQTERSILAI